MYVCVCVYIYIYIYMYVYVCVCETLSVKTQLKSIFFSDLLFST